MFMYVDLAFPLLHYYRSGTQTPNLVIYSPTNHSRILKLIEPHYFSLNKYFINNRVTLPDFPNAFCTHCFALHDEGSPLPFLKYLPVLCFHNLCLTDGLTFRLECYKDVICSFVWYFFCKSIHSSSGMKCLIKKHHRKQSNLLYIFVWYGIHLINLFS